MAKQNGEVIVAERVRATKTAKRALIPSSRQRGEAIRSAYAGKFTQVQLAAQLGVAQNTVSRWSTGDIEPSLDDIARIEDICGLMRGTILRWAGYVAESRSVPEMIAADDRLDATQRELLLSAYRSALARSKP